MRAFHNDPAIKAKFIERVKTHMEADEIIQRVGYENGRGCAVECILNVYDVNAYPDELGLPIWIGRLEDAIHEGLPLASAKTWPLRFLQAIAVGADVDDVQYKLMVLRMNRLLEVIKNNNADYMTDVNAAIREVIRLCEQRETSDAAEAAARSAAEAAEAAWSAARSAAEAAEAAETAKAAEAAWSARSAARSARSAARSAAESVADSARSAAEAADSAELAAAEWEAEAVAEAAWEAEANDLLMLLNNSVA